MTNQTQILQSQMELIKVDLVAKHRELGMRASGQWEESLEVDVKRLRAVIKGAPYTDQLVNGRPPTSSSPESGPLTLTEIIKKWIIDKGSFGSAIAEIGISSLAFLIARKIHGEGTNYFQQGGTDLVEAVITPERIQSIIDSVSEFYIDSFTSEISGFIKKMAA